MQILQKKSVNLDAIVARASRHSIDPIESNLVFIVRLLDGLPDVEVHDDGDAIWSVSATIGRNNELVFPRFQKETVDQRIQEIQRHYRLHGVGATWWIGPNATPVDLGSRLCAKGFSYKGVLWGMQHILSRLSDMPDSLGTLRLVEAVDVETFNHSHPCFGDLAIPGHRVELDTRLQLAKMFPTHVKHLVALRDNEPVGAATLCVKDSVGIYDVCVVKSMRAQGIGGRIVQEILRNAQGAGFNKAVVQATSAGMRLYHRLGFRKSCKFELWQSNPSCG